MKPLVIDASIVVKLFFEEEYSDLSAARIEATGRLIAPEFMWIEATNVVWKRLRRGELTLDQAMAIIEEMLRLPIETYPADDLIALALTLAADTGRTVYDCVYVALAVREGCTLLTGDQRLVNGLRGTPAETHIQFVGDPR